MQWILGFPLLILCLRPQTMAVIVWPYIYILICLFVSRKHIDIAAPSHDISFYLRPGFKTIFSFAFSLIMTASFWIAWSEADEFSVPRWNVFIGGRILICICVPLFFLSYICLKTIVEQIPDTVFISARHTVNKDRTGLDARGYFFLFISASVITLICSKSSPLYPFNDWADANIIFTVGKSMLSGRVPYRDLVDQKGPIMFAVYALAALISYKDFTGLWVIEAFICFLFLVYSCKTLLLFSEKRVVFPAVIAATTVYASLSFAHGGSAEELCLPAIAYALYVGLQALMNDRMPSAKECFIIGLTSACVFWIKYTMVGYYLGWIFALAVMSLRRKDYKQLIRTAALIMSGVAVMTVPVILYFIFNGAVSDLWDIYFYNNIIGYNKLPETGSTLGILHNMVMGFTHIRTSDTLAAVSIPLIIWETRSDRHGVSFFVFSVSAAMLLFVYAGGRSYVYYAFIFSVFAPLGVLFIREAVRNMLPDIFLVKNIRTAAVLCLCTCCVISLTNDNRYLMFTDRDAMPQYKFMRDIEKSGISNPTLLNYKFMDAGFYTTTGIVPDIKYFTSLNSLYQSIEECQNYWADNGLTDFIVMQSDNVYEFDKYVLMDSAVFWSEGADRTYWLYRRIY